MKGTRLYLKFPTIEDKENILDFKAEFLSSGQKMAGVGGLDRLETFEEWFEKINNDIKPVDESRVPATIYLSYRKTDNKLIGMLQIRHKLNEKLFFHGGHIGDCIRPTEQCKGYATEQIGLAIKKCKDLGIDRVLITCNKKNIASAKTIMKNYGVLENEVIDDGEYFQRYWVEVK